MGQSAGLVAADVFSTLASLDPFHPFDLSDSIYRTFTFLSRNLSILPLEFLISRRSVVFDDTGHRLRLRKICYYFPEPYRPSSKRGTHLITRSRLEQEKKTKQFWDNGRSCP